MKKILLISWNATEGEEHARFLRGMGFKVRRYQGSGGADLRAMRDDPPDLFVIDLARSPAHGRAVATWLRQQRATRRIPIVFVGGDPEKTQRVRDLLPDAAYTRWNRIRGTIRNALRTPIAKPVVPGTMDVYVERTLVEKLGVRADAVIVLLGAPAEFEQALGRLPKGARITRAARGRADVVILFAKRSSMLERKFDGAVKTLREKGRLWIAWPKKASGVETDLTQASVRAFGLRAGFVDYKISAFDRTWSGLCFAARAKDR